jgi:hypothetical protein
MHLLNVLSSPATLTGAQEKKTGPSRFRPLFSSVTSVTLDPIIQKPELLVYAAHTGSLQRIYNQYTLGITIYPHV